jgi:hypothetical protein
MYQNLDAISDRDIFFGPGEPLSSFEEGFSCERYPTNAHNQFFNALISSPTCFGFQVPSSGGYNFFIYKLLQVVYKV